MSEKLGIRGLHSLSRIERGERDPSRTVMILANIIADQDRRRTTYGRNPQ